MLHLLNFGILAGVSCNGLKIFNNLSNCNFVCNFISGSSEKPTNGHNIEYSEPKYLKLSSAMERMELEYCDLLHVCLYLYLDCIKRKKHFEKDY